MLILTFDLYNSPHIDDIIAAARQGSPMPDIAQPPVHEWTPTDKEFEIDRMPVVGRGGGNFRTSNHGDGMDETFFDEAPLITTARRFM